LTLSLTHTGLSPLLVENRYSPRLKRGNGPIYRLLLLTGLRLNEVADAVWSEFDLPKGIWTIPASRMKGKNGKARPHSVPLTADILAILGELFAIVAEDYLRLHVIGPDPAKPRPKEGGRGRPGLSPRLYRVVGRPTHYLDFQGRCAGPD